LLKIRSLKTTGITIEVTEMENCLGKRIVFFRSVQGHLGTACKLGQVNLSLLIFLIQLTLPLNLDWARLKVHSLLDWLKFYTNFGEGL
jgi:hypothetical protein